MAEVFAWSRPQRSQGYRQRFCAKVRSVLKSVAWSGEEQFRRTWNEQSAFSTSFDVTVRSRSTLKCLVRGYWAPALLWPDFPCGVASASWLATPTDLVFMRNIQNQYVDSSFLLGCFPPAQPSSAKTLTVPCPTWTREHCAIVQSGMFCRLS